MNTPVLGASKSGQILPGTFLKKQRYTPVTKEIYAP
jgi:hypothetical protein